VRVSLVSHYTLLKIEIALSFCIGELHVHDFLKLVCKLSLAN